MPTRWVVPSEEDVERAGRRAIALAWCAEQLGMDPGCGVLLYRAGASWWIATAERVRELPELDAGSYDDALRALHRVLRETPAAPMQASSRVEDRAQLASLGEQLTLGGR